MKLLVKDVISIGVTVHGGALLCWSESLSPARHLLPISTSEIAVEIVLLSIYDLLLRFLCPSCGTCESKERAMSTPRHRIQ
jgi:hypothetical protein